VYACALLPCSQTRFSGGDRICRVSSYASGNLSVSRNGVRRRRKSTALYFVAFLLPPRFGRNFTCSINIAPAFTQCCCCCCCFLSSTACVDVRDALIPTRSINYARYALSTGPSVRGGRASTDERRKQHVKRKTRILFLLFFLFFSYKCCQIIDYISHQLCTYT